MQQRSFTDHGLKWGLIIGTLYCILLWMRYQMGESNPVVFGLWMTISFIMVLVLLFISGVQLRRKAGGYMDLKETFKILFLSVLILELLYALFNFIYLKYINPDFFVNFKAASETMLENAKQSQEEIDRTLKNIDVDAARNMNIFDFMKSYLFSIAVTGIFAFFIALIVKRNPPAIQPNDRYPQA